MAAGQLTRLPSEITALQMVLPTELARIAASSPQPSCSGLFYLVQLEYLGGQVKPFPRGLLLRAGSRLYKYCWVTAPYYYFSFCFFCFLCKDPSGFGGVIWKKKPRHLPRLVLCV
jgi:hypothetical protein